MYSNAKNTANYLAKSETLLNIALRTGTIRTSNVHSVDAITALSLVHFYVRSRDRFAKLGGNASFYTYINRIFDDKCELVSRIRSRCKVRPWQTYSLRNRHHLSLSRTSTRNPYPSSLLRTLRKDRYAMKNSAKKFAELKTLRTFAFGEPMLLHHYVHSIYAYIKRCLLSTSAYANVSVLQNLTRQRLFCCIFKTFNDEWRTELKAFKP